MDQVCGETPSSNFHVRTYVYSVRMHMHRLCCWGLTVGAAARVEEGGVNFESDYWLAHNDVLIRTGGENSIWYLNRLCLPSSKSCHVALIPQTASTWSTEDNPIRETAGGNLAPVLNFCRLNCANLFRYKMFYGRSSGSDCIPNCNELKACVRIPMFYCGYCL